MTGTREQTLRIEEIKAIKLFLTLFYTVFIGYDITYYYVLPYFDKTRVIGFPDGGLGFFSHILLLFLLPAAVYMAKKGDPFRIKYMYFIAFLLIEFADNFLVYWGSGKQYSTGNIVEILFLLFAPIFVNKTFFWFIFSVMTLKYVAYGFLFQTTGVMVPIVLMVFFGTFGFILLTRIVSYVNGMVRLYEDSQQKEKLAVVGQMAASIAHEIKNPLSALKGFTQLQQERDGSTENFYPIMLNEIDRINLIVSDLLIIGKPNSSSKQPASIGKILTYVTSIIEPQAVRQSVNIHVEIKDHVPKIYCDENQIKQVFINLVKNAVESMPDGGVVTIEVQYSHNDFFINVSDGGEGIPADIIAKLGEPFFTTKPNGTGLGLMVTKKIIEEHGGKFDIRNNPDKGATVQIILPGHK
jgi:signal transduction histidine kinase